MDPRFGNLVRDPAPPPQKPSNRASPLSLPPTHLLTEKNGVPLNQDRVDRLAEAIKGKKQELLDALRKQLEPPMTEQQALNVTFGNIQKNGVWREGKLHKLSEAQDQRPILQIFNEIKSALGLDSVTILNHLGTRIFEDGMRSQFLDDCSDTNLVASKHKPPKKKGRRPRGGILASEQPSSWPLPRKQPEFHNSTRPSTHNGSNSYGSGSLGSNLPKTSPPPPRTSVSQSNNNKAIPLGDAVDSGLPRPLNTNTYASLVLPKTNDEPVSEEHKTILAIKGALNKYMLIVTGGQTLDKALQTKIRTSEKLLIDSADKLIRAHHDSTKIDKVSFDINSLLTILSVLPRTKVDKKGRIEINDTIDRLNEFLKNLQKSSEEVLRSSVAS